MALKEKQVRYYVTFQQGKYKDWLQPYSIYLDDE